MILAQQPPVAPVDTFASRDQHMDRQQPVHLTSGPVSLPARFAQTKQSLLAGKEQALTASWCRLLKQMRLEVEFIASNGADVIPSIEFDSFLDDNRSRAFIDRVRERGAGIIRGVVAEEEAVAWQDESHDYLRTNPLPNGFLSQDRNLLGVYWSPAQVKARAHGNVLSTQKLLMQRLWKASDPTALVSTNCPVAYADRVRIGGGIGRVHVDGGSVERWEPDGYGRSGVYKSIWEGNWEEYDPWDIGTRIGVNGDLYNGAGSCSASRLFQGWLSLEGSSAAESDLLFCPMLKRSTVYFLLRPFFKPKLPIRKPRAGLGATAGGAASSSLDYLDAGNWELEKEPSSILHGAVPGYVQELNDVLHPHLQLGRSMVRVPSLRPGDYVVWHTDLVYAVDGDAHVERDRYDDRFLHDEARLTVMHLPICPLTQTNALYLARQRKAFVLGHPSPDFGGGRGESAHIGRPGVHEVNEVGGDDGLRSLGLLPWDEDDAENETELELLRFVNAILFPDFCDNLF